MTDPAVPEEHAEEQPTTEGIRRLNWGCAGSPARGWMNGDVAVSPGLDVIGDLREGLPLPDASLDYIVTVNAFTQVPHGQLEEALSELKRLLRTDGVLRLEVPDLERSVRAYLEGDVSYFPVPDDQAHSLGAKLILHLTGADSRRSLYTFDALEEVMLRSGFRRIARCQFGETASEFAGITELDDRDESLFVEGIR